MCFGHRGAMGHAPENTLKSIAAALKVGVPWIEIDVHFVDGHLIVFHDHRLERTTNGSGCLNEKTFSYLRSLDAGDGEKIPTLDEVFDLVSNQAGINIELKGSGAAAPVVSFLHQRLGKDGDFARVLLSSFNHHEIAKVKQLDHRILTGALIAGIPIEYAAFAQKLGAYSVNQHLECVTEKFVEDAHWRGLKVFVYTVDHPEDIRSLDKMGVDGLFSNHPERVLAYLESKPAA